MDGRSRSPRDESRAAVSAETASEAAADQTVPNATDGRSDKKFCSFTHAALEQTIAQRFEQQAKRFPNRLAVRAAGDELTYRELDETAESLAKTIVEQSSVDSSRPVALLHAPSLSACVGILAAAKTGRPFISLDPTFPLELLQAMWDDTGAAIVVADSAHAALALEITQKSEQVLTDDEPAPHDSRTVLPPPANPADPAYILYSSGSTSRPKGVIHSHRALLHDVMTRTNIQRIVPRDRLSLFSWGTGQAIETVFRALHNGAALVLHDIKSSTEPLAHWLRHERITIYTSSPSLFRRLASSLDGEASADNRSDVSFPDLRIVRLGAEELYRQDVEAFRRLFPAPCELMNGIASTETLNMTMGVLARELELVGERVPLGRPVDDKEIQLVDESGASVPRGEIGEIVVRSRYMSSGYWGQPEKTATAFEPDPQDPDVQTYRTRDLARWRSDGQLEYIGRKDFMAKIRGFRVELPEVERALIAHETVREAACTIRQDGSGNKQLLGYYVLDPKAASQNIELAAFLRERLPEHMVPARLIRLEALPRTPNGKLDRSGLPEPPKFRAELQATFVAPRYHQEEELVRIWEELLHVEPIGIRHDFFEVGGDSLQAVSLIDEIQKQLDESLSGASLIAAPTIEQQAVAIAEESKEFQPLLTLKDGSSEPPLFCVGGWKGLMYNFRDLAACCRTDRAIYGVQYTGLDGRAEPKNRMETIAADLVATIRSQQPQGPYSLCGYSFGGLVAYEMARQLTAASEEVAFLGLFDSMPPHSRLGRLVRDQYQRAMKLFERNADGQLQLGAQFRKYFAKHRERPAAAAAAPGAVTTPGILRVRRANTEAAEHHRLRAYTGAIVLFRAMERVTSVGVDRDPLSGWGKWVQGGVEVCTVPGSHRTLMDRPHVETVARRIDQHFRAAPSADGTQPK